MNVTFKPTIKFSDDEISSIWDIIYLCQEIQEKTQRLDDQTYTDAATQVIEGLDLLIQLSH